MQLLTPDGKNLAALWHRDVVVYHRHDGTLSISREGLALRIDRSGQGENTDAKIILATTNLDLEMVRRIVRILAMVSGLRATLSTETDTLFQFVLEDIYEDH